MIRKGVFLYRIGRIMVGVILFVTELNKKKYIVNLGKGGCYYLSSGGNKEYLTKAIVKVIINMNILQYFLLINVYINFLKRI